MKKTVMTIAAAVMMVVMLTPAGRAMASTSEVVIVKTVSFREQPSASSANIHYLKTNEVVQLVEKVNPYWYKVKDQAGHIGYVSANAKYTKLKSSPIFTEQNDVSQLRVIHSVTFRSQASTSGKKIRTVKAGELLQLVEKVNAYWYKVKDSSGKVGYVSANAKYTKQASGQAAMPVSAKPASPSVPVAPAQPAAGTVQNVIEAGKAYLGTPYEYGSDRSTTDTFDCSDFTRQVFWEGAGIRIPADSRQQADYVKQIGQTSTSWKQLQPGDLMFFMSYKGSKASHYEGVDKQQQKITHVAIYLGNGKIMHTYSKESGGVKVDSIEGTHWEHRFVFGGSVIKE